jgi:hypothetical protein
MQMHRDQARGGLDWCCAFGAPWLPPHRGAGAPVQDGASGAGPPSLPGEASHLQRVVGVLCRRKNLRDQGTGTPTAASRPEGAEAGVGAGRRDGGRELWPSRARWGFTGRTPGRWPGLAKGCAVAPWIARRDSVDRAVGISVLQLRIHKSMQMPLSADFPVPRKAEVPAELWGRSDRRGAGAGVACRFWVAFYRAASFNRGHIGFAS